MAQANEIKDALDQAPSFTMDFPINEPCCLCGSKPTIRFGLLRSNNARKPYKIYVVCENCSRTHELTVVPADPSDLEDD